MGSHTYNMSLFAEASAVAFCFHTSIFVNCNPKYFPTDIVNLAVDDTKKSEKQ